MILHRIIRTLCCLPLLLPAACEHPDGNELFTEVSIRLVMPDSRPVERLEILTDISYFYNLNTYERTAFPETVERNRTTVRLRPGHLQLHRRSPGDLRRRHDTPAVLRRPCQRQGESRHVGERAGIGSPVTPSQPMRPDAMKAALLTILFLLPLPAAAGPTRRRSGATRRESPNAHRSPRRRRSTPRPGSTKRRPPPRSDARTGRSRNWPCA